jgi:hypothetical protein
VPSADLLATGVAQPTQKPFRRDHIGGAETFRKPSVNRLKARDGVRRVALIAQQASEAHCGAQLQGHAPCWCAKSSAFKKRSSDGFAASSGATTLATVNPSVVLGPVLSRDFSESVQAVQRLLSGRAPGLPRLGFSFVDVRDVADLHIRAMTAPEAAGQRFIAAGDFAWMVDLAALLRARLGDAANKVPTRQVPDLVVRLAALFDKSLAAVAPRLGEKRAFTLAKAQEVLGWRPTFVGRNRPRLRQEPDRYWRGLKGSSAPTVIFRAAIPTLPRALTDIARAPNGYVACQLGE